MTIDELKKELLKKIDSNAQKRDAEDLAGNREMGRWHDGKVYAYLDIHQTLVNGLEETKQKE